MEEQAVNNQVQQAPVNPEPASKKPNQWIIISIALILVVVVGSIFVLFLNSQQSSPTPLSSISPTLSSTTDPTANWETYTNTKYGFSLKYPSELSDYVLEIDNHFRISYPGESVVDLFTVDVYETKSSPVDWWNQIGNTKYPWIFNTAFNEIEISGPNGELKGVRGIEVLGQSKSPGGSTFSASLYLIPHNSYLFVLSDNSDNESNYDKIIKTFKFTNQEDQVVCTQDAKLCPDGKTYVGREGPNCEFAKCP